MKGEECYGLGLLRAAEFLQEEKKGVWSGGEVFGWGERFWDTLSKGGRACHAALTRCPFQGIEVWKASCFCQRTNRCLGSKN